MARQPLLQGEKGKEIIEAAIVGKLGNRQQKFDPSLHS